MLVSEAATIEDEQEDFKVIIVADIKNAFYEARAQRDICMEIPEEDRTEADRREDTVGKLELAMPGTRDAGYLWQAEIARWAGGIGFERGKSNPCIYEHKKNNIKMMVHGDDFMGVCRREEAAWLKGELEGRFTAQVEVGGHGKGDSQEIKMLNRIIRATPEGWEYEADQRHAELLIQAMGVQGCKGIGSPGEEDKKWEVVENEVEVDKGEERPFRAGAARGNYLAADRIDIQYATKEICLSLIHI